MKSVSVANCGSSRGLGPTRRRRLGFGTFAVGGLFGAVVGGSVVGAIVVGCSDATVHSDCGSVFGGDTNLINWWRVGDNAESAAQDELVGGYAECSGGTTTVESTKGDKEEALRTSETSDRQLLLVNGRSDIDRLECTSTRNSGLFALHDLEGTRWRDRIPDFMWPYVAPCGGAKTGKLYAVPVGLHTLNQVIVSPHYAERLTQTRTAAELLVQLKAFAAEGNLKPIIVPHDVERSFLLVENVMVAVAGERYEEFWNMNRDTESPDDIDMTPFEATLDYAEELLNYVEFVETLEAADQISEVMGRLCSGQAAFTIQADWVNPEDFCPGLVAMPFPGTAQYDVFSFDAFAVDKSPAKADPKAPDYLAPRSDEYAWLKAVTSREVQAAYAKEKHSRVLVRSDAAGNTVALTQEELFGPDVKPLPGLLLMIKHTYFDTFKDKISEYLFSPRTDAASVAAGKRVLTEYVHKELCDATTCDRTTIR